jgi:hypothetical protein
MGLKPQLPLYFINPFTKVNGNKIHLIKCSSRFIAVSFS